MDFQSALIQLEYIGLTDVLLPFLLIFVIIFAILQRVNILGDKKNLNVVFALIIALTVVIPHVTGDYPYGRDPVEIMNEALPGVSLVIVAIIMFFILVGAFGVPGINLADDNAKSLVSLFAILVVGYIFGNAAGWWGSGLPYWLSFLNDPDFQAMLVVILVFGLIIMFVTKEDKSSDSGDEGAGSKLWKSLGQLLKSTED